MDVVPPATRSTAALHRRLALACALACTSACRPATSPAVPEPAASPTPGPPAKAEAPPRVRGPEEIVATVDGVPIREADVTRHARVSSTDRTAAPPARDALVLQLIERRLIAQRAEQLGFTVSAGEIDRAVEQVAARAGLTTEELQAAVRDTTSMSWEEYRDEIAAQILELRLVMTTVHWLGDSPVGTSPDPASENARFDVARGRLLGCLWGSASVSVEDASVELPGNQFATTATLTGVRFASDPILSAAALEAAATTAAAGLPLCDAIPDAEAAMLGLYLERGYLDAQVKIPWPTSADATVLEVEVTPGRPNVLGDVRFDQSAVPKAKRLKEKQLRRRIASLGKAGDVAASSRLRAISDAVSEAFLEAGLGPVMPETRREEDPEAVRLHLVFHVSEGRDSATAPQSPG